MISAELNKTRIAITGATGFLGTALVERLLRSVPESELVLVVRPGRRGAQNRLDRDIFRNDAFERIRSTFNDESHETFEEMCRRRVFAVAGDVGADGLGLDPEGLALLATCDIVIHSAATVSFDSALDDAVEINLLGPMRVAAAMRAAAAAREEPTRGGLETGESAHLIAVSTCYVAGSRRGSAPEELIDESPFFVDVDWQTEVDSARRARIDAEQASRTPQRLSELAKQARRSLGAAGGPALTDKVEQLRQKWVAQQLTDAGRSRASSLGFPDAYAFTKALGERALVETRGNVPVSIVRPSIIESAFAEPAPGWIRGFRMAEPVIAAYARGLLKEFPGIPEGVIDIIPVDLVVATILAVATRGPEHDENQAHKPDVVQIASGAANPLMYAQLVDLVRSWFNEHPVYDDRNQPISVPEWSFPGRGRVVRQLGRAKKTLDLGERALNVLPLRGKHADFSAELEERKEQLERANGYVELYGAYAECEALYLLDRMYALWESLDEDDRRDFSMDPRVVHWPTYVQSVHLPSMVKQARLKMQPGAKSTQSRSARLRKQVLAHERQLAVFDLENTLIASNVVASYAWLATRHLNVADRMSFTMKTLREAPALLSLDRQDRSDFLRYFYRRFEGAPVELMARDSREMLSDLLIAKSFPAGIRRVREHRALGHKTLLITGALDFVVEPLRPLFDHMITAEMTATNGSYDGQLIAVPPTGEARYQTLVDFAEAHDLDLRQAVAYADSSSDLPMLEAVGFPVAVNAETKLASIARRRGWLIEHWAKSAGAPNRLLPISPRAHREPSATRQRATRQRATRQRANRQRANRLREVTANAL
ncbi:MAG: HAD-IB family phosphatase [Acidimicrobiaceae bacterium]|nr:HAD-IB family phosphatase [Acidimicrobiaceae bacterium]